MKDSQKDVSKDSVLKFQKYGVKIGIQSQNSANITEVESFLKKTFPNGLENLDDQEPDFNFKIEERSSNKKTKTFELRLNGEKMFEDESRENFYSSFESRIRLTIAEFAAEKVFLHAGVIGWNGKALIIPASSFAGKTTLVAELIKKGAEYYSDEYAVLDAEANVEPFPKWLSIRGIIDDTRQVDCPVESLGGVPAQNSIPPGMILLAKYKKGRKIPQKWQPQHLKQGEAVMELLPHTMSIRNKPQFVLEVLNKLTNRAIIVRTLRGEAADFAQQLLDFFDLQTKKS